MLSLYDSKSRALTPFTELRPGEVSMYVCGPTVQSAPHIGHLRSALVYDQLRRWLTTLGKRVVLVRNVTDIDDKILANAAASEATDRPEPWWALAMRVEREFDRAYEAIGVIPPTASPRATGHIGDMIALIDRLIAAGHAYVAEDGSGSVYFDARSWDTYGVLTRQSLDDMDDAADGDPRGKRDARDFALWKGHRANEPESASWQAPWGRGRPGWHIECSAMATRLLGNEFDIHGGGLDLRFPHHENELAQSQAAGDPFARIWMHNGLVNTDGQKMSKSLGNSLFAHALLDAADPLAVRYFLGSAHYRSQLDYTGSSLDEAAAAVQRISGVLARAERELPSVPGPVAWDEAGTVLDALPTAFVDAMNDDLAIPAALAAVHAAVRGCNQALNQDDSVAATEHAVALVAMVGVLGIDPRHPQWRRGNASAQDAAGHLVQQLVDKRTEARAAKDFATGDAIRDSLAAVGITLEDGPNGTHWSASW